MADAWLRVGINELRWTSLASDARTLPGGRGSIGAATFTPDPGPDPAQRARFLAMSTLPLATVKNALSAVVDQVESTHERVVITRKGVPAAVLISPADLAALEETLDVLSDPETMDRLRRSREDAARGDVLDAEQLRTLLEAPGR